MVPVTLTKKAPEIRSLLCLQTIHQEHLDENRRLLSYVRNLLDSVTLSPILWRDENIVDWCQWLNPMIHGKAVDLIPQ